MLLTESVWLMTRSRIPAGPVMQEAYGILDKFKISRTFFVRTDQEGCALAASDINAANGITSISTVAEATGNEQKRIPVFGRDKPQQREEPIGDNSSSGHNVLRMDAAQVKESDNNEVNNNENSTTEQENKEESTTETNQSTLPR